MGSEVRYRTEIGMKDGFHDGKDLLKVRRPVIGMPQGQQDAAILPGTHIDLHLLDQFVLASLYTGKCQQIGLIVQQNLVPIDPPALYIVYIIAEHENIYRVHKLKITKVGKYVGLHYSYSHLRPLLILLKYK